MLFTILHMKEIDLSTFLFKNVVSYILFDQK